MYRIATKPRYNPREDVIQLRNVTAQPLRYKRRRPSVERGCEESSAPTIYWKQLERTGDGNLLEILGYLSRALRNLFHSEEIGKLQGSWVDLGDDQRRRGSAPNGLWAVRRTARRCGCFRLVGRFADRQKYFPGLSGVESRHRRIDPNRISSKSLN
jgi:hypothetical protein